MVCEGQCVVMVVVKVGVLVGSVDDVVCVYYFIEGYGFDYVLFGLLYCIGYGIGMEGYESVNFVCGESMLFNVGMCFLNELGIYILGEFGVRLEDCLYMIYKGFVYFMELLFLLEDLLGKLVLFQLV